MSFQLLSHVRAVTGILLVCAGFGVGGYITGWTLHQRHSANILIGREQSMISHDRASEVSNCVQGGAVQGQLIGILSIPSLHLLAPVEQGVSNPVLAVAVGHFPQSVTPGGNGASVMLAHDVSYFSQLNALKEGSLVEFQSGCTVYKFQVYKMSVVQAGSSIPNTSFSSIVLDTCWPTDALWFTPTRYLVFAKESSVMRMGVAGTTSGLAHQIEGYSTGPSVPVPASLAAQGLTLQDNEVPMGTMTLVGNPAGTWVQSPGPLAVEASGLKAYFGAIHALAARDRSWWNSLAPGVEPPAPLQGAPISQYSQYTSPFDVTVRATGSTPVAVVIHTSLYISGGNLPGQYSETVVEKIVNSELTIEQWAMRRT